MIVPFVKFKIDYQFVFNFYLENFRNYSLLLLLTNSKKNI